MIELPPIGPVTPVPDEIGLPWPLQDELADALGDGIHSVYDLAAAIGVEPQMANYVLADYPWLFFPIGNANQWGLLSEAQRDWQPDEITPHHRVKLVKPRARRPIPTKLRFAVLSRDGFTCQYCGAQPPDAVLQVDHIVPISRGGSTTLANLRTACRLCNIGKGVQILEQYP